MEFGVGIHGEPGIERRQFVNLDKTLTEMFNTLIANGDYERTVRRWNIKITNGMNCKIAKKALQKRRSCDCFGKQPWNCAFI